MYTNRINTHLYTYIHEYIAYKGKEKIISIFLHYFDCTYLFVAAIQ